MNQAELLNELNTLVKRREECKAAAERAQINLETDPSKARFAIGDVAFEKIMTFERDALNCVVKDLDYQITAYQIVKVGDAPIVLTTPSPAAKIDEIQETIASLQEKTFLSEKPLVNVRNPAARVKFEERQDDGDFIVHIDKPAKKQSKAKLK
jgi:hypothetical protein